MSNNSEYNDLNRCLSEYKYWNDKCTESWEKNPDPIDNKEYQLYEQKYEEVLTYIKETYNIKSIRELRYRVQELERWQQLEQQPTHHIAAPQLHREVNFEDRYKSPPELDQKQPEQQPHREVNFEDRYKSPPELDQKQPEQQPTHHIAEPRPRRQFDFEDRYK